MLINQRHLYFKVEEVSDKRFYEEFKSEDISNYDIYLYKEKIYFISKLNHVYFYVNLTKKFTVNKLLILYPSIEIKENYKILYKVINKDFSGGYLSIKNTYSIKYLENFVIEAINTLGVFTCMENIDTLKKYNNLSILLALNPVEEIKESSKVSFYYDEEDKDFDNFYKGNKSFNVRRYNDVCKKVLVLENVLLSNKEI